MASASEAPDDVTPMLTLCPATLPLALSQFLNPNHSIQKWLIAALPLVMPPMPNETPVVQVIPVTSVVTAPLSHKLKATAGRRQRGERRAEAYSRGCSVSRS
jgi:hypothetical protein